MRFCYCANPGKFTLKLNAYILNNVHCHISDDLNGVWSSHSAEDWKAVNEELQKSCRYVIKNQTTGDRLKIRVVAMNAGGRSPPVTLPEPVLVKEVAGKKYLQQLGI